MRCMALAAVLALAGCAHLPNPYAALPSEECAVFVDLIDALDDPARPKGGNGEDYAPSMFPAGSHLDTPIDGPSGKADVTTCGEWVRRVRAHDAGSMMALHDPYPDGPTVLFSRVSFDKERQNATFTYAPAWGPLGLEVWALTMRRGPDGHWKLTASKLQMES